MESYSYGIPTVALVLYVMYIVFGVYGFFIPVVMSKRDSFIDYFWQHIDRDRFARDVHKIILSGIIVVLMSVFLMVSDIMSKQSMFVLVGILIWISATGSM